MKKEKIIYFFILAFFAVCLVLTRSVWAAAVTILLLFYLLLAVLIRLFSARKVQLSLRAEEQIQKQEEAAVHLTAENQGWFPLFRCDAVLKITNLLTGTTLEEPLRFSVFSRKSRILQMSAKDSCCGILRCRVKSARAADPLGLFSRPLPVDDVSAEILVEPHMESASYQALQLEHYDMESFRYADHVEGNDSSETIGVREYELGDSVRAIHWKLSAKTGELQIKQYGFPVDTRILILADKQLEAQTVSGMAEDRRKNDGEQTSEAARADQLTEFCLGVSLSLIGQEVTHGFGWVDRSDGSFYCRRITSREDLFAVLPEFLRAPVIPDAADTALHFLESEEEKHYSSYIYIAEDRELPDAGLEKLKEYGYVTVLTPERKTEYMD